MAAIGLIVAVAFAVCVAALMLLAQASRDQRRQRRLSCGFERAKRVRQAGTGEQGQPYSIYTDQVWRH